MAIFNGLNLFLRKEFISPDILKILSSIAFLTLIVVLLTLIVLSINPLS
jgi:hypothetical protein